MAKSTKKTTAAVKSESKGLPKIGFGTYQRGKNVDYTRLYLNKALLREMLKNDDKQYDNLIINLFPNATNVQATAKID